MGLKSFLVDKTIALIWFISAAFFFYAGVSASNLIGTIFIFFAAICIAGSFWMVRRDFPIS